MITFPASLSSHSRVHDTPKAFRAGRLCFILLFLAGCAAPEDDCVGADCAVAAPDVVAPCEPEAQLYINEFMSKNESTLADESGEMNDWVEIYNGSDDAIDMGGMYVSDREDEPKRHQIPSTDPDVTTVEPGGFLILWADKSPEEGILHLDIKLSSSGESITLTDADGETEIDFVRYGAQETDISFGRLPNGCGDWWAFMEPTPGSANQ